MAKETAENSSNRIIKNPADFRAQQERRRTPRVENFLAKFFLVTETELLLCKVTNLSRLGIGIEVPPNHRLKYDAGDEVKGTLEIGDEKISVKALVRLSRDVFLGLEFFDPNRELALMLDKHLSPKLIAESIIQISENNLNPDIEIAFRGEEFECLIFKEGSSKEGKSLQIFAKGQVLEIQNGVCRYVPAPLVRASSLQGGWDFLSEFSEYKELSSAEEIKEFLTYLQRIILAWKDCPSQLKTLVDIDNLKIRF